VLDRIQDIPLRSQIVRVDRGSPAAMVEGDAQLVEAQAGRGWRAGIAQDA
jgi:hypothetical protein